MTNLPKKGDRVRFIQTMSIYRQHLMGLTCTLTQDAVADKLQGWVQFWYLYGSGQEQHSGPVKVEITERTRAPVEALIDVRDALEAKRDRILSGSGHAATHAINGFGEHRVTLPHPFGSVDGAGSTYHQALKAALEKL